MKDNPITGLRRYWTQKLASVKSEFHAVTNKYQEAASVVQQVYKVLKDTKNFARWSLAKMEESSETTSIVNSVEESRASFCAGVDRTPLFSGLYCMYMVTLSISSPLYLPNSQGVRCFHSWFTCCFNDHPRGRLGCSSMCMFFISSLWYLSIRHDLINLLALPVIPYQFNFSSKVSWLTPSNALARSQKIPPTSNFLSRAPMI
jgi:hypothetical protein